MKIKFAVIADMHLPYLNGTVQHLAFDNAIEDILKNAPGFVVVAGDISAKGDISAFDVFKEKIKNIAVPCYVILGNADVRNKETEKKALSLKTEEGCAFGNDEFVFLNTQYGYIDESDRNRLLSCGENAVVFMHHSVQGLDEDSRKFINEWAEKRCGAIIHAHSHKSQDYFIGNTRVIGVRCTDPEKSVGAPPCITYFEVKNGKIEFEEKCIGFPTENLADFRDKIGISCFDIYGDIDFATENNIKNIEIRKFDGSDEELAFLDENVEKWRKNGGECVSVHMPNLKLGENGFEGIKLWNSAARIAIKTRAERVTVHPPRNVFVSEYRENSSIWKNAVDFFYERLSQLPKETAIGIENIHFDKYDVDENQRFFGYTPEEIIDFVKSLNDKFGFERVGFVFDIGHARNNGPCYTGNTLGVWYKKIGEKITGYHIHQVAQLEKGKKNHAAITDWEGERNICFTSFLWAWQINQISHKPMFMEMKTRENCKTTLDSLEKWLSKYLEK